MSTEPETALPHAPQLADVLAHKPPMVLLDAILSHTAEGTACVVRIGSASAFADAAGSVPSWIALEYMAQCAAAHSGLRERSQGRPIRIGFLLGSRRIVFHTSAFEAGQELEVGVRETWNDGELASFSCTVRDRAHGGLLAECELAAYSPQELQDVIERQPR